MYPRRTIAKRYFHLQRLLNQEQPNSAQEQEDTTPIYFSAAPIPPTNTQTNTDV
eukprot:m.143491 g.143491  ORF g.143491 m.143491 type:complete len:54 (-) comp24219_c0_seq5:33-194(-)